MARAPRLRRPGRRPLVPRRPLRPRGVRRRAPARRRLRRPRPVAGRAAQPGGRAAPAARRRRSSPTGWRRSASATTTRCSPTTTAAGRSAARLVWMLRVTGHEAALLDGGLTAFDGPLETEPPTRPRAAFTPRPWPADRLADADDALDPANVVLDGRAPERFRGEVEPVDPRAGHVPGARSLPVRGQRGRRRPVPAGRRAARAVRRRRGHRRQRRRLLLRLRRERLPQPARPRAGRLRAAVGSTRARGPSSAPTPPARWRPAAR